MPSAYVNSIQKPSTADRLVATNASTPASTGPLQGAAMRPATRPMPKACPYPVPFTPASFACSPAGSAMSKAPNIEAASATRKTASTVITTGDESADPKALPESAAKRPSAEYVSAIPPT